MGELNCAFCNYRSESRKDLDSHFTNVHEKEIILMEEPTEKKLKSIKDHNSDDKVSHKSSQKPESKPSGDPKFYNSSRGKPVMEFRGFEYLLQVQRRVLVSQMTDKHQRWRCRLERSLGCRDPIQ